LCGQLALTACGRVGNAEADPDAVTPDNALAGQCIDIPDVETDIVITERDCDEVHDAEIVLVSTAAEYDGDLANFVEAKDVCISLMESDKVQKLVEYPGEILFHVLVGNPEDIQPDDTFLCYVVSELGQLDAPIL